MLVALVTACASPDGGSSTSTLGEAPRLVEIGPRSTGPDGSDAVPTCQVAFRMADGTQKPVDRDAIAFVPRFRDGAALIDPRRRLYEVTPDGMRRMLVADASGSLTASPEGDRIAYVVVRDVLGELRVHDGETEQTLAGGLASIGVLRFVGDRVLFVGGRPGGVAGIWIAAPGAAPRCVTNCALRTGTPWGDAHVPPPSDPSTFALAGDTLSWTDPDGTPHAITLSEAP